jgi:hypothetical protein
MEAAAGAAPRRPVASLQDSWPIGSRIQGGEDPPPHLRHCQCRRMRSGSNSLPNGKTCVRHSSVHRRFPVPPSVSVTAAPALSVLCSTAGACKPENFTAGCRQSDLVAARGNAETAPTTPEKNRCFSSQFSLVP